jgi:hypothetical protein
VNAAPKCSSVILQTLAVLCLLGTDCTPFTQQNLAPCTGSYTGTFNGFGGGTVTAALGSGNLTLTFTPNDPSVLGMSFGYSVVGITGDFVGRTSEDVSDSFNVGSVSGSFDTGACRIGGTWAFQGRSGTWFVRLDRP